MNSIKVYVVTLLTMAVILGPLVVMGAHGIMPQIHFTHGVSSGDVTTSNVKNPLANSNFQNQPLKQKAQM
jgi:hypothetical protein